LIPEDIETDGSVGIDVWVVDLGCERDLGGFEGVVWSSERGLGFMVDQHIPVGKVRDLVVSL
jgi:hypothetical protein